ncbi:hypothetical protein HOA55_03830 [archaeon]|jgi:hypothetical protein|nr:hypothetical protein [archaeon]MBT3577298.1 hypothetical protein [archaeon]MBT6820458.1 hypothetical protein [archaeon]MBT6956283.1 hypothetical protein [archaeon]MBT7025272.1 hypothetical protein [archaeon]
MENDENCEVIEEVVKEYDRLKGMYTLPDFDGLSEDFDIEKSFDKLTRYPLREIRRAINEKFTAYFHLFETLMNPSSPPMFIFSVLKGLDETDKKSIREIYKKLAQFQLRAMERDTVYDEREEAKFVFDSFGMWQGLKGEILNLIGKFDKSFEGGEKVNNGGYFG